MAQLFGVHENIAPADTVARVGGTAARTFTGGVIKPQDLIRAMTVVCGAAWAAGLTAFWSFKPSPGEVANGAWKPYFETLAAFLRDNPDKRTVVVIWHEPENDVPRWFADAAAFRRLFDTCAGWLRAVHPGVVLAHAALGYRYGDIRHGITDQAAGQWRTSADLHCIDVYSGRSSPLPTILPELASFRRWRRYVAGDGAWGVTERGWAAAQKDWPLRAATMAREGAWLAAGNRPQVYLLWNTSGTENDPLLIFDASAEAAARSLMAQQAVAGVADAAAAGAAGAIVTGSGRAARVTVPCPLCAGAGTYTFTPPVTG
jgi:hypothetical protein